MSDQQNPQHPPYPPQPPYPQYPQYAPYPPHPHVMVMPQRQRNGLGVFGFFVAVIGLFIPTGIVAILGLLLCLAAVGRPPRMFAMLGLFIGLIGTVVWLIIDIALVIAALLGILGAFVGAAMAFMLTQPEVVEVTTDMVNVAIAAEEYRQDNDKLPADMAALSLGVATLTDPWGKDYRFVLVDEPTSDDHPGYDIISSGPDGAFDTDDDIQLTRLGKLWENAFANFEENMEEFGERMEKLQHHHHGKGPRFVINSGSCTSELEDYETEAVMEIMRELEQEIAEQITIIEEAEPVHEDDEL